MLPRQDDLHGVYWGLRTAMAPLSVGELHSYLGRALGWWIPQRGLITAIYYSVERGCVRANADGTFSWLGAFAGQ